MRLNFQISLRAPAIINRTMAFTVTLNLLLQVLIIPRVYMM